MVGRRFRFRSPMWINSFVVYRRACVDDSIARANGHSSLTLRLSENPKHGISRKHTPSRMPGDRRSRNGPCLPIPWFSADLTFSTVSLGEIMSDHPARLLFLATAGCTLPAGYIATCLWLRRQRAWWFLYPAYFALFGTLGGWTFAFSMSPSGMTATSIVFLVTAALAACVTSAVVVTFRKKKSRAEWIALVAGYLYPACLAIMLGVGFLLDRNSR